MAEKRIPVNFDEAYPGRFLKAGNLGTDKKTVTISEIFNEVLVGEKGDSLKLIVSFKETDLQIVLCKLNGTALKGMFGPVCADWVGKRIVLFATDQIMPFPGKKGDERFCIRIWGSPDIAADVMVDFRPPKRKNLVLHMHATTPGTGKVQETLSFAVRVERSAAKDLPVLIAEYLASTTPDDDVCDIEALAQRSLRVLEQQTSDKRPAAVDFLRKAWNEATQDVWSPICEHLTTLWGELYPDRMKALAKKATERPPFTGARLVEDANEMQTDPLTLQFRTWAAIQDPAKKLDFERSVLRSVSADDLKRWGELKTQA